MKILMANKFLYPRAGAEVYMLTLAAELKKRGHQVAFFGMERPDNTVDSPCYYVPEIDFSSNQSMGRLFQNLGTLALRSLTEANRRALESAVASFQPDLIHAHNIYNQISPRIFQRVVTDTPVVMTVHDFKPICPSYNCFTAGAPCTRCIHGAYLPCVQNRCIQGSFTKSILAAASAGIHHIRKTYLTGYSHYIAPSHFLKGLLLEGGFPSSRISVVHNFAPEADPTVQDGGYYLYIGRICAEKGVETLLRAYERLGGNVLPLKIAGSGPDEERMRRISAPLGGQVQWLGRVSHDAVSALIEGARGTITPSLWYENCSISILESLGYSKPCIASKSGGNTELIRHGATGFLFDPGNDKDLAAQLQALGILGDAEYEQMCQKCLQAAREDFAVGAHVQEIEAIYGKIVQSGA